LKRLHWPRFAVETGLTADDRVATRCRGFQTVDYWVAKAHRAHIGPGNSLANRFSIGNDILIGFHGRFHKLRRH